MFIDFYLIINHNIIATIINAAATRMFEADFVAVEAVEVVPKLLVVVTAAVPHVAAFKPLQTVVLREQLYVFNDVLNTAAVQVYATVEIFIFMLPGVHIAATYVVQFTTAYEQVVAIVR